MNMDQFKDLEIGVIFLGTCLVLVVIAFVIFLISVFRSNAQNAQNEKARKEEEERWRLSIFEKYGGGEIAERILNKSVWVGETSEQLQDSLGPPLDVDVKVLKTKKREIWKYVQTGRNRYGLKFTLENDVVVGWDERL